ncbi:MAG: hypothetical protein R8G01_22280 [Ilumatobacteraceae bacterium]|nr:hypothetical protein [Ilumatobacteraceae bacterium]
MSESIVVVGSDESSFAGLRLQEELLERYGSRFHSTVLADDSLSITLAPEEADLAAELKAEFGRHVNLTVGLLPFPLDAASPVCGERPTSTDEAPLSVRLEMPDEPVDAGGAVPARLTGVVTNEGRDPVELLIGYLSAVVLQDDRVVNGNGFSVPEGAVEIELAPGSSEEVEVLLSTASCDPDIGYVLPAGRYPVVAVLGTPEYVVVSPPVDITVS